MPFVLKESLGQKIKHRLSELVGVVFLETSKAVSKISQASRLYKCFENGTQTED